MTFAITPTAGRSDEPPAIPTNRITHERYDAATDRWVQVTLEWDGAAYVPLGSDPELAAFDCEIA